MKFAIKNIGPIKSAEITMSDLTIICGKNNTGKTYLSYSFFGFCDFFRKAFRLHINDSIIEKLIESGDIEINLTQSQDYIQKILDKAAEHARVIIPVVFAAEPSHFKNANIKVEVSTDEIVLPSIIRAAYNAGNGATIQILKKAGTDTLSITLVRNSEYKISNDSLKEILTSIISRNFKLALFNRIFPSIFFASAERTGTLMFRDELSIERGKDIKSILNECAGDINATIDQVSKNVYPIPVIKNISFMKQLRGITRSVSTLSKRNPKLIHAFDAISGGVFSVDDYNLYFTPADNAALKLAMEESSSSVRSLVSLSFWIRHIAEKGKMLMIDEPEMNLHPSSQRMLARWIAMLVNAGVKVFVTTHSDYFVKELNTLIMLYKRRRTPAIKSIMKDEGIDSSMLLPPSKISVYVAERNFIKTNDAGTSLGHTTIHEVPINPAYGMAISSFDDTIEHMNQLQEKIIFNG